MLVKPTRVIHVVAKGSVAFLVRNLDTDEQAVVINDGFYRLHGHERWSWREDRIVAEGRRWIKRGRQRA